jgi:hypothetical protein
MNLVSKLATAALVAVAVPAISHADGRDSRRHDRDVPVVPAPVPPDPRDTIYPGVPGRFADHGFRPGDYRHDRRWEGRQAWRIRELREVHQAMRALDLERSRFYALRHTRREVRRFERMYALRMAQLEQRRDALQAYAWR